VLFVCTCGRTSVNERVDPCMIERVSGQCECVRGGHGQSTQHVDYESCVRADYMY
jgi:hypothetical protein